MADQKQLEILKSGEKNWNKFRDNNPKLIPDLSLADLSGADLSRAILVKADLNNAKLSGADLSGAFLIGADLMGANLSGANLSGANLMYAKLMGTGLSETIMDSSIIGHTTFSGVNLSKTKVLDTCRFMGSSYIDYHTLAYSGTLPLNFLRGCGLSNQYIDHIPALFNKATQFYSCFISYSSKDEEFAKKLYSDLQNAGIRCWFAPKDIKSGQKLYEQIERAIDKHEKLLLILSNNSIKSNWVGTEIAKAREREEKEGVQILFPVSLTTYENIQNWKCFDADRGKDSAKEIREYFIPDFTNWENDQNKYKGSVDRLIKDLEQENKSF